MRARTAMDRSAILSELARQRHATNDGSAHLGAEDRRDHPDRLEEGGTFSTPAILKQAA